mgnify:CR=1 FL=1
MERDRCAPVVGLDVPAEIGMPVEEIATPALIIELDQFEKNVKTLKDFIETHGVRLRAHAKTHKSADVARYQMSQGGACGVCCQKVSEAQALVSAGIDDVLVSNQVVDKRQIRHLAETDRERLGKGEAHVLGPLFLPVNLEREDRDNEPAVARFRRWQPAADQAREAEQRHDDPRPPRTGRRETGSRADNHAGDYTEVRARRAVGQKTSSTGLITIRRQGSISHFPA